MVNRAGNSKFLKKLNRAAVLELIRKHGVISRTQLVKETGLTATAVSDIIGELLEKDYVEEIGTGESSGGRRPINLRLKPEACYALGVDIDKEKITVVALDFAARKVGTVIKKITYQPDVHNVQKLILEAIEQVREECKLNNEKILGVGLGIPGLVNPETGHIHFIPNFYWENIDLKEQVAAATGLPTYVANEAKVTTLAEYWLGGGKDHQNFVCINVRTGIGAGLFINGQLYQGMEGSAGEIGHSTVEIDGPKCSCGNYGCLEALVATPSIVRQAVKAIKQGRESMLQEMVEDIDCLNLEILCRAAEADDQLAEVILRLTGRCLGIGLANIINLLNPAKIILGGDVLKYRDFVAEEIERVVSIKALGVPRRACEIVFTQLGEEAPAIGAGVLVLHDFFRLD